MNNTTETAPATSEPTPESTDHQTEPVSAPAPSDGLTFWQMLGSVMAAAFGVQSKKNRERDFSQGKPMHFIVLGIGFTVAFVLIMAFIVQLVLSNVS